MSPCPFKTQPLLIVQLFIEHLTESLALCCARRLESELNKAPIVHLLEALAAGTMSGSGPVCLVKDKGGAQGLRSADTTWSGGGSQASGEVRLQLRAEKGFFRQRQEVR